MKRIYEISIPHFTPHGTFHSAIQKLDEIAKYGADTIYLLPIHPVDLKSSRSPYCITNHLDVRNEIGGLNGLNLFIAAAHNLNLNVVLDVVLNHASKNHTSASDPNFFALDENNQPFHPVGTNWNDVFQINHFNEYHSEYLLNSLVSFLEMEIDGFRFDATSFLPDPNLESWLSELIQKKPDVILWSDSKLIEKDTHPFTHVSVPMGQPKFYEPRKATQIASLGSHDLLRNEGSLRNVYGENIALLQQELIQDSDAFLFPMGSEKGFDFRYDFFL